MDACHGAPNCKRKKWIDTKLEPEFVKVVAGYVHTYPPEDEDNANTKKKWLDVINIKTSSSHQFAIVTLKHMIEFDFVYTLPLCLPVKAGKMDMYKGRSFIIHGWGYNKGSLQNLLDTPIQSFKESVRSGAKNVFRDASNRTLGVFLILFKSEYLKDNKCQTKIWAFISNIPLLQLMNIC